MHRMPMGPMGADKMIPIDTQPIIIDNIVPTGGAYHNEVTKVLKNVISH